MTEEKKATRPDAGGQRNDATSALGGNHMDQRRQGASVDESVLTKGERRRGGSDVR